MPSPTWRTLPTSARSTSTSKFSIRSFRIEVISSGLSFTGESAPCGRKFVAEALEAAADAGVDSHRADLQDEAADQVGVDRACRLDLAAGRLLDLRDDRLRLGVGELDRGRQVDLDPALLARDHALELGGDLVELGGTALLDEQAEKVADELLGALEDVPESGRPGAGVELRVAEQVPQLGHGAG